MKSKVSLGLVALGIVLLPTFADSALARSVSAFTGQARLGDSVGCFVAGGGFTAKSIKSACLADFIVPLTVDNAGTKSLTFTGRATSSGAQCRVVANDPTGTALSTSPFRSIPVGADFASQTTNSVSVPAMGVFFADCMTNDGTELYEFDYTP